MQEEQLPSIPENEKPAIKPLTRKLSRKHKAFADAYLLTLNATEAYKVVFKPKCPEYAYKNAYKLLRYEGISRYVDEALLESSEANYRPEAIKQGIQSLAQSARRESDRLRAYELMSKISGLINDNAQNQVNVFTDDIMTLAKKRLSERRKDGERQNVKIPESPQVIETKDVTDTMSYNNPYVPTLSESVLSINTDAKECEQIDSSVDGDGLAGNDGSPRGTGSSTPTHPSK